MVTDYTQDDFPEDWSVYISDMDMWNEDMRISPQRFKNSMLYGLKPDKVSVVSFDRDRLLFDASIGETLKITRNFDFKNKTVDHSYFTITSQGQGTAKRVLLNQISLYREFDFREVTIHANIDVGGYAWAKYGFVPSPQSWRMLHVHIFQRLQQLEAEVLNFPKGLKDDVIKILTNDDPKALWTISDLKPKIKGFALGKLLLLGSDWYGSMDL